MASHGEEDLVASTTAGFKVGEKKTLEEYTKLGEISFITLCSDLLWHVERLSHNLHAMTFRTRFVFVLCHLRRDAWIPIIAFRP